MAPREVSVLGPVQLLVDGQRVALRPREAAVLAALALRVPAPSTADEVADLLWPHDPPPTARKAVQNHVVRLRRVAGAGLVVTEPAGYCFAPDVTVDAAEVVAEMEAANEDAAAGDHRTRAERLGRVLDAFRGEPFADLPDGPAVEAARRPLRLLRWEAEEAVIESRLALGDASGAARELARLTEEQPLRERRWWLLMLAQYRAGRRRDALATFHHARSTLGRQAGLEPGDDLRRLERLIAAEDPVLLRGAVLAAAPPPTGLGEDEPVVGRHGERARLRDLLDEVRTSGSLVVTIEGEAGIGKTTLARWLGREARGTGARMAWGACEAAPTIPLQPFAGALEDLRVQAPAAFARWAGPAQDVLTLLAPVLSPLGPARPPAGAVRHQLGPAVVDVLTRAARDQPLVVVLDDLHLAPPATRQLAEACQGLDAPLLVVATARVGPEAGTPLAVPERLRLGGLSRGEVREYLGALAPGADDEVVDWMLAQTAGNPLLLRELSRSQVAGDLPTGRDRLVRGADRPPETIAALIEERLATLAADTRATLDAAAVLGPSFRVEDLDALAGNPVRALDEATRAGLVAPGPTSGWHRFSHDLLHRVVLEAVPEGARTELHGLAAAVVERADHDGTRAGEAARHHLAAAALDPPGAVASARDAARAAMERFAYEEAADLNHRALEVARTLGDARLECELVIDRGEALRRAGDPTNVEVLLEAVDRAEDLGDGDLLGAAAFALCQLGPTTVAGGSDERAAAIADRALERATDPFLRSLVAGVASMVHSLTGDHERCRAMFERAEREARAVGDQELLTRVLPFAYLALGHPDDLDRRRAITAEVEALAAALDDPATEWEARHLWFSVRLQAGDPALFDDWARLRELTDDLREPSREWTARYLAAAVAHLRGDLERAEAEIDASLAYGEVVSPSRVLAVYGGQLLGIRLDQGRLGELAELVEATVADQPGVPAWHAAMALVAAEGGDHARARAEFDLLAGDGFAALPRDVVWSAAMAALGRAVGRIGDGDRAALVHARLVPYAGRMTWFGAGSYGPVDDVLADTATAMGDLEAARCHRAAAEALTRRLRA